MKLGPVLHLQSLISSSFVEWHSVVLTHCLSVSPDHPKQLTFADLASDSVHQILVCSNISEQVSTLFPLLSVSTCALTLAQQQTKQRMVVHDCFR